MMPKKMSVEDWIERTFEDNSIPMARTAYDLID